MSLAEAPGLKPVAHFELDTTPPMDRVVASVIGADGEPHPAVIDAQGDVYQPPGDVLEDPIETQNWFRTIGHLPIDVASADENLG